MSEIPNSDLDVTNSFKIQVSAPGKVILHGEHSVVHGYLAVAASLGLRTTCSLNYDFAQVDEPFLQLELVNLNYKVRFLQKDLDNILNDSTVLRDVSYSISDASTVNHENLLNRIESYMQNGVLIEDKPSREAVLSFLYLYCALLKLSKCDVPIMHVRIESKLKLNSGMGSSASYAVSIAGAFIQFIKSQFPNSQFAKDLIFSISTISESEMNIISQWAYAAEKIIHGSPSGIDNSTCTYGSIIEFYKGKPPKPLKMVHKLNALLIDTKVPKNTKELIQKATKVKEMYGTIFHHVMEAMGNVAKEAIECLKSLNELTINESNNGRGDVNIFSPCYNKLQDLADINQNLLRILNVSHPCIEKILRILSENSMHGKLTGAGGGGFVLSIIPINFDELKLKLTQEQLQNEGFDTYVVELGGDGVNVCLN